MNKKKKIFFFCKNRELTIYTCCVRNDYSSNIIHVLHSARNYNHMYAIWKKKKTDYFKIFFEQSHETWMRKKEDCSSTFSRSFLLY